MLSANDNSARRDSKKPLTVRNRDFFSVRSKPFRVKEILLRLVSSQMRSRR